MSPMLAATLGAVGFPLLLIGLVFLICRIVTR